MIYVLDEVKISGCNQTTCDFFLEKFIQCNSIVTEDAILTNTYEVICTTLFKVFWSISFQDSYDNKLKSNNDFIRLVLLAAQQPTTETQIDVERRSSIRNSAQGILTNLDIHQEMLTYNTSSKENENGMSVMVSYAHRDAVICQKLVQKLKERISSVWVDFEKQESNDCWEDIAHAITASNTILIIATENYCASKSCRREAIHADKRGKRIIPIFLSDYQPEEWLEIRIENATYVKFNKGPFEETMVKLIDLILINEKKSKSGHADISLQVKPVEQSKLPALRLQAPYELKLAEPKVTSPVLVQSEPKVTSPVLVRSEPKITSPVLVQSELKALIPGHPLPEVLPKITTETHVNEKALMNWTQDDVKMWFHHERLNPRLCELFSFPSGPALLTYAKLILQADDAKIHAEYEELSHRLNDELFHRDQYAVLMGSLEKLISRFEQKPISDWNSDDVQRWFREYNLPSYLYEMFGFSNGQALLMYARLLATMNADNEYERLKKRLEIQYGKPFYLSEHAKLLNAMIELTNSFQKTSRVQQPVMNNSDSLSCSIM
ncbi:unnamed protein product [Didymodactylos carnosus]|uniref:TIR domain-containing protein n=1 Tax=Didymodactylos carnosus TaxID=1234261 RepID=A0A814X2L6_9BILA|nr:unnamed protein product [Didymodactylos carnosus]CAF1210486.1 unnamed protein product [Didymodactylos carnosus]CAF3635573.1 unnamed protein product [Didymodactylos carnosus]CAF3974495.1 unnamed protein product [Didymodactylos carnosus]